MTDVPPPHESPDGKPFELPAQPGEQMLDLAGFKFQEWLALETAGLTIDFDAFARPELPAGEMTIYRPELGGIERALLDGTAKPVAQAVMDTAITDQSITNAGREELIDLYSANLQDTLLQRLAQRRLAIESSEKLHRSPVATVTAAFLLMGHESFRALGANNAQLPGRIAEAFKELDKERRDLPGGAVFAQMLYRGGVRDSESFYQAARERGTAFFDKIISVINDIDDDSLLAFEAMSKDAAARCKTVMPMLGILEALERREISFRSAIIEYARYMEEGESHFGDITQSDDGTYKIIGVDALKGVCSSTDQFLDNEYFRRFFPRARHVQHLPGVSDGAAHDMRLHHRRNTAEDLRAQCHFQSSIVYEIVILLHKIERYYADNITKPHDLHEQKMAVTRLDIARGMVIELLMISEFFADTVERNNAIIHGLVGELNADPETAVKDPKKTAKLKAFAHLVLGHAAGLSHARRITLRLFQGAFS